MYAYCLDMPGVDEDTAARVEAGVGPQPVEGLIAHVSGPSRDGWRIIDVWATEADQQAFQVTRLGPALAVALTGRAAPSRPFDTRPVTGREALSRLATS